MNAYEREQLRGVTAQLNESLTGLDFSATFGSVFIRRLAVRLKETFGLSYPNAIKIASTVKCEVQLLVESDEDREVVYEMVEPYVHSITSIADEICDDDFVMVDILENIAAQSHVTFS